MKRFFDIFMVLLSLPFWLSVLIILAAIVKFTEPRAKVFFSQTRLGKNGKPFLCYKIRSMMSKEGILEEYLEKNQDEFEYFNKYHKLRFDPRITKIGKILRKTSLDELPQLFNVILGDMSLVGPRPYLPNEGKKIKQEDLKQILSVRPGLTGLWQISGRSDLSFSQRVQLDVQYTKTRNMWLDTKIFFITFYTVLAQKGSA